MSGIRIMSFRVRQIIYSHIRVMTRNHKIIAAFDN